MKAVLLAALAVTGCATVSAADFRIYWIDKEGNQRRVFVLSNAGKPGCHSLPIKRRVYRVAQVGFKECTIYAERDCQAGTELTVSWKNKKKTTTITPGARWFLEGERGSEMGSWHCVAPDEDG